MAQSREERLRKKREAEKRRHERLKQDLEGAFKLKEKEKAQYAVKKRKGIIKPIDKCTPKQQRLKRKQWRRCSQTYRTNSILKTQQTTLLELNSPLHSETESIPDVELLKQSASKRRANKLRKQRSNESGSLNDLEFYLKNNVKGVTFFVISEDDIDDVSKIISLKNIQKLKGTMTVHQVLSKESFGILEFRQLSYFDGEAHPNIGELNFVGTKSPKMRLRYNEVYSVDGSQTELHIVIESPESIEKFTFTAKDITNKTYVMVELEDERNKKQKSHFQVCSHNSR